MFFAIISFSSITKVYHKKPQKTTYLHEKKKNLGSSLEKRSAKIKCRAKKQLFACKILIEKISYRKNHRGLI